MQKLISGLSEDQLDNIRSHLLGCQGGYDGCPDLIAEQLAKVVESPDEYDLKQVMQDVSKFCEVCIACGYFIDTALLDLDDVCEECNRCSACGEDDQYCTCDEDEEEMYGFGDEDFDEDDDDFDELDGWEGDDWDDD